MRVDNYTVYHYFYYIQNRYVDINFVFLSLRKFYIPVITKLKNNYCMFNFLQLIQKSYIEGVRLP